jgi:hypothetical protein
VARPGEPAAAAAAYAGATRRSRPIDRRRRQSYT